MRHGDKINNLSRTKSHRKALLKNLANQLIINKRIVTTVAKAKALRVYIEPLLTKSKNNTTHSMRIVFKNLQDKESLKELFTNIAPKIATRMGGYTRIIKLGKRLGDNAEIAMIELVDYNTIYNGSEKADTSTKAKRTRRSSSKKKTENSEAKKDTIEEAEVVSESKEDTTSK